jgi:hypothetical protein
MSVKFYHVGTYYLLTALQQCPLTWQATCVHFSTTSGAQSRLEGSVVGKIKLGGYHSSYLSGRDQWLIIKGHGLGQWPALHLVCVLSYHLLK